MKAVKKGKLPAKKAAPKAQRKKKPSPGTDKPRSRLESQMATMKKDLAEKETLIRKLKGQVAGKTALDKTKGSLLAWKSKAEQQVQKLRVELAARNKDLAGMWSKIQAEAKKRAEKLTSQKDGTVKELKKELAEKELMIQQSEKTLREAMEKAGGEVSAIRQKTNQTLSEWKSKAEAEYQKLKEEMESKSQALAKRVKELEEYKKAAQSKMTDLQAGAKEAPGRLILEEKERTGLVMFKGNPMTLVGEEVKVGDRAPNFQAVDNAMQPVTLDSFKGKFKIITSVPSLDTPVCDMETRRFNEEAGKLPDKVVVLTISMDLPFAQKRWCAAAGVEKVKTLSDFQGKSFGCAYGVLIKELKLLARTVFIVDDQDLVRYVEIVPEITKEPEYDRVLNAAKALL